MSAEPSVQVSRDRAYYEQRRLAKKRTAHTRRRVAVVSGIASLVLFLAIGVGFAGSTDRIPAGVAVAGIDVGGLTPVEAEQALAQRANDAATLPVVFVSGQERFEVVPSESGVAADWSAAIGEAMSKGDGFLLTRGFERLALRLGGADVAPTVATSERALDRQLDRFAGAIDHEARDAAIVLDGLTPVVQPAQTGIALDRTAAGAIVTAALSSFERTGPVELPVAVVEPKVRQPDLQQAVQQVRNALSGPVALTFRKRTFVVQPQKLATFLVLPKNGDDELALGGKPFRKYLATLSGKIGRDAESAGFTLTAGGRPRVVPAKEGRTLDRKAAVRSLLGAALATAPSDRNAALAVEVAQPKVSTAEAKAMGITGVVSSYTTVYGGEANRLHNVRLVAALIDDHLIAPGATFSFNETTGERNADLGFLEAPVIINGELKTGLGGGVCQVSTTVFNAAYEAGLPIDTRTNHALYIDHYPTGRDATVNYPDTDLGFTNDTGNWLWVRAFAGSSELTVVLYGTPTDRTVETIAEPVKVGETIPVKPVYEPDLYVGERWVEDAGEPTRSVAVRRIVRDADGNVLYDTVFYSSYLAEPKIVHVGTKKREDAAGGETAGEGSGAGSSGGGASGGGTDPETPTGSSGGAGGGSGGGGSSGGGSSGGGSSGGGSTGGGSSAGLSGGARPVAVNRRHPRADPQNRSRSASVSASHPGTLTGRSVVASTQAWDVHPSAIEPAGSLSRSTAYSNRKRAPRTSAVRAQIRSRSSKRQPAM